MSFGLVLALFRAYMGFFWLDHGWGKIVNPQWASSGGMMDQIVRSANDKSAGAFHNFVNATVLPNEAIFANLVAFGETLVGISLLVGLLSRLGALGGMFLALNYWFLLGGPRSIANLTTLEVLVAVACAVHVLLPTGRVLGLDAFMGRRTARAPEVVVSAAPPVEPPIARPVQYPPAQPPPPPTA